MERLELGRKRNQRRKTNLIKVLPMNRKSERVSPEDFEECESVYRNQK